ncbi:MAG: methyl-accepting chemotaxis protein [Xylophilus ampelinus]
MNISHWPLARRLGLAFGGVIAVFLAVIAMAMASQKQLTEAQRWSVHTARVLAAGEQMLLGMVDMETGTRGFALAGRPQFLEPWEQGAKRFREAMQAARGLTADNPEQQRRLAAMDASAARFMEAARATQALRRQVDAGAATLDGLAAEVREARGKAAMDGFRTAQAEFLGAEAALQVARDADAARAEALAFWWELGGCALAVAAAVVLGAWVTRSITRPVAQAVAVARAVAAGDLTSRIGPQPRDEVGQLLDALRTMNASLVEVVARVRQGSESVAATSTEIAQGNSDLSSRTESQASALQETAASMEQLGSTVAQNADNARQANQLAQATRGVAEQGGTVVEQVVETMRGISESSNRIADIINVIDGIAFQTNILALNAAVEAARAGEQGRGFAVVAGEVRSLAGRSAEAAKQIKQLIGDSVSRVESGAQLADRAGRTMAEVVGSIRRMTDLMGEISAASAEQSAGVRQVGEAVGGMDRVTQQNAALVEQMAAAAASLSHQAQDLVQSVSLFRLGEGHRPAAAEAAPKPAPLRRPMPVAGRMAAHSPAAVALMATAAAGPRASGPGPAAATAPSPAAPAKAPPARAEAVAAGDGDDWEAF